MVPEIESGCKRPNDEARRIFDRRLRVQIAMYKRRAETSKDEKGFVLIVVIWGIALLLTIVTAFSRTVGTHIKVAGNKTVNAQVEAAADAGVHLALMQLARTASGERNGDLAIRGDGTQNRCRFTDDIVLSIEIEDEGGKVDLNAAPAPLLGALFEGFGAPADKARALAEAVLDFRDADDTARPFGAEARDYRAANLSWTPGNGKFLAIEELEQVYGMTQSLFEAVRPYVTVHSKRSGIDPSVASPSLLEALRGPHSSRHRRTVGNIAARHSSIDTPKTFLAASAKRSFRTRVVAYHASGGVFVRTAIIEATPKAPLPFTVHTWHRGERDRELEGETSASESALWKRLNGSTLGAC